MKQCLLGWILGGLMLCSMHVQAQDAADLSRYDALAVFTSLDSIKADTASVFRLELRKQKLKEIPNTVFKFSQLRYLDLSKNAITEIPDAIGQLTNLEVLILSRNQLERISPEIKKLKKLKYLNVNQNELVSFPSQLSEAESLEFLDAWSNNIDTLPDELRNLKNLKVLDLRVIQFNHQEQERISNLFPQAKIYFSPPCKCAN